MICEYYKSRLNGHSQKLYEKMLKDFSMQKSSVDCSGFSQAEISNIYIAVYNDHPEFFFLTPMPQMAKSISIFGEKISLISNHIFSKQEVANYRSKIVEMLKNFSLETNIMSSLLEKEKVVCEFFLKNVFYEINNIYNQNAATVLVNKKGQCSGISKAVKLICDYIGIECIIVEGTAMDTSKGTSGPHGWNILKIDGEYTHLDVTFMIGANMAKKSPYNYLYYNYTDSEMDKNHTWDRSKYPKCVKSFAKFTSIKPVESTKLLSLNQDKTKNIFSYVEFESSICRAIEKGNKEMIFHSRIKEQDDKTLLNKLLVIATKILKQKSLNTKINISKQGFCITVRMS